MMRPATWQDRLRLLRDCGAARARIGDRSFGWLVEQGWASVSYPKAVGKVDYRLTRAGREAALHLTPQREV